MYFLVNFSLYGSAKTIWRTESGNSMKHKRHSPLCLLCFASPPSPRGSPALVRVSVSHCIRKLRIRLPGGSRPDARPPRAPPAPLAAPEAPPVSRARLLARPSLVAQSVGLGTRLHSSSSSTSCSSTSRCAFSSLRSRVQRSSSRGTAGRASGFAGAAVASGLVRRASTGATSTEAPAS